MANPLIGIAEGWRRNVEAAQRLSGNAAHRAAPKELLGVYAKHCPLGHVMAIEAEACGICVMEWEAEDRRAKDREAGRDETTPADEETYGND